MYLYTGHAEKKICGEVETLEAVLLGQGLDLGFIVRGNIRNFHRARPFTAVPGGGKMKPAATKRQQPGRTSVAGKWGYVAPPLGNGGHPHTIIVPKMGMELSRGVHRFAPSKGVDSGMKAWY